MKLAVAGNSIASSIHEVMQRNKAEVIKIRGYEPVWDAPDFGDWYEK